MKKLIILGVSALLATSNLYSQEEKRDFSEDFPKKGTFSIGMDMANVIQFIGNSFSSAGTQTPNYSMVAPSSTGIAIAPTVYGRYFLSDNIAARVRFGLGIDNSTERAFVYDDIANIDNPFNDNAFTYEKTVDERKTNSSVYELGLGIEMRKNLWRIQGYGGAELFGSIGSNSTTYTYGNAMSAANPTPTTISNYFTGASNSPELRPLETKGGTQYNFGGGLYVGADFFITKGISIGAEFNLFLFGRRTTEQTGISETYKLDQRYVGETKLRPVNTGFSSATLGTLNINVYF
ncbi:hypothetical protein CW751_06865 [Brumimicrobium salinarum]|uniref:Outer membrane protein beta-barrel domain-containing protein n=1 Tax=Brumimicrobium salinarum TaxID=2058658 RepID=A0A2I0R2U4_9FLAO|nr:hypothetical protein [Brumimicrobium salinarum]PKR80885.1 hypothetical protein CW751_06865 [Brumimicrobium salinarum]